MRDPTCPVRAGRDIRVPKRTVPRQRVGSTWTFGASPSRRGGRPRARPRRRRGRPRRPRSGAGRPRRRVEVDGAGQARRRAQDADGGHVLERDATLSTRLGSPGEPDVDHPPAGLDEVDRQRRHVGRVGGVDDGVPAQRGHAVGGPDAGEARATGRTLRRLRRATQVHLDPLGAPRPARRAARWCRRRGRAAARPGATAAPRTARSAFPPGSTSAPGRVVDRVGQARAAPRPAPAAARRARPASRCGCRPRSGRRTGAAARPGTGRSARSRASCRR